MPNPSPQRSKIATEDESNTPTTICIYLFRGKVFIPVKARPLAGFLVDIEPVRVLETISVQSLQDALTRVAAVGNPTVPDPPGGKAFPRNPILKHAGVGWRAFDSEAEMWVVELSQKHSVIIPCRHREDRGFEEIPEQREVLRFDRTMKNLAARMSQLLSESARFSST